MQRPGDFYALALESTTRHSHLPQLWRSCAFIAQLPSMIILACSSSTRTSWRRRCLCQKSQNVNSTKIGTLFSKFICTNFPGIKQGIHLYGYQAKQHNYIISASFRAMKSPRHWYEVNFNEAHRNAAFSCSSWQRLRCWLLTPGTAPLDYGQGTGSSFTWEGLRLEICWGCLGQLTEGALRRGGQPVLYCTEFSTDHFYLFADPLRSVWFFYAGWGTRKFWSCPAVLSIICTQGDVRRCARKNGFSLSDKVLVLNACTSTFLLFLSA